MIDWASLNYDDPCALLDVLRPAFYRLLAGEQEIEIQYESSTLKLSQGSVSGLRSVINELESKCAQKNGGLPRRHAIAAGFRY